MADIGVSMVALMFTRRDLRVDLRVHCPRLPRTTIGALQAGYLKNTLDGEFQSEVSQALALKLDLKTRQHANDKMLNKLIRSGGNCSSLKQAVQARAAIYGEAGEPS